MCSLFTLACAFVCVFVFFLALLLLTVVVVYTSSGARLGWEGRGWVGETGGRGRAGSAGRAGREGRSGRAVRWDYQAHTAASHQVSLPREA